MTMRKLHPRQKLYVTEPGSLPLTAVPTSVPTQGEQTPLDTVDNSYRRAQQLKPCPIIAHIGSMQRNVLEAHASLNVHNEAEEILEIFAGSKVRADNKLEYCKATASQRKIADFSNMAPSELRKKADNYRSEVARIKALQEELVTRIQELPAKSKSLWLHLKEATDLDTSKYTYRYDYDEHVLYVVDPDCTSCVANKNIKTDKEEIEAKLTVLRAAKES